MKIYSLIIAFFIVLGVNAQTVNSNYPFGVYKFGIGEDGSEERDSKLIIDKDNNFSFSLNYSGYDLSLYGRYCIVDHDTINLIFASADLFGKVNDDLTGKLKVELYNNTFSSLFTSIMGAELDDNGIYLYKNQDTTSFKLKDSKLFEEWHSDDTLRVELSSQYGGKYELRYVLPSGVNDVTLSTIISSASKDDTLKVVKNELSPNELIIWTGETKSLSNSPSLFFIEALTENNFHLMGDNRFIEPIFRKYENNLYENIYSSENTELVVYDNFDEALLIAQKNNKLLRIYNNADMDSATFVASIKKDGLAKDASIFVFANVRDDDDVACKLTIMSPQKDIIYGTDSLQKQTLLSIDEGAYYNNMTGNYLIDYNKILDKRIAERSKNDEFYIKQYLINFNRLISSEYMNESDSVDSKVKQYLERYIEKYCGYGPDSLTMNTSFLYALQAMSNEPDSVKNSQLPSYLRYLLINKDNTKLLAQNISSRFYSLNRDNLPLLAVLSYFSVLNNNSFSVYEEAIKLAPEYEDYFYMLSMISQDEVLSEKDIITVKKYLDRVTKGITVPDELSNISSHSASEVINELAKKMFEFDKNNYFQEGAKFNDIYEISSFYNDMLATTFNNFAWRVYRNKDTKYIDDMIRLSRISLDLEPDNHYYLDTYAHLLYTKGNKEKAVEYEQRAYDLATAKGDLNSVESKMYKLRLHAMKTGTLEKYNTDEWNQ